MNLGIFILIELSSGLATANNRQYFVKLTAIVYSISDVRLMIIVVDVAFIVLNGNFRLDELQ